MNSRDASLIALHLCRATQILIDFYSSELPDCPISCRIGSGQRTYCQARRRREGTQTIITSVVLNYGKKMVTSKSTRSEALGWTTGKEIVNRGYFNREINFVNMMAAVVLHEFAHVIQNTIPGARTRGSVHNRHFYSILDRMHREEAAQQVVDYLKANISFEWSAETDSEPTPPPSRSAPDIPLMGKCSFVYKGQTVHGVVTKKNRKTWQVTNPRASFKVSPHLLTPVV